MGRAFTGLPADGPGDKLAMRTYTEGADLKHSQGVFMDGLPSYRLLCESGAPAANKYHIYLGNNTGSGQTVFLTDLRIINLQTAAVTGVLNRFNFRRVTGTPTLTSVTPYAYNSADAALANVTSGHTVTAGLTDSTIIQPILLSSEEGTAVPANTSIQLDRINILPAPNSYLRALALRPGEAFAVRQVDAGTVGSFAFIMDFAVEPD